MVDGSGNIISVTGDVVLRGCRGADRLWRVLLVDGHDITMSSSHLQETINNVFDLRSTEQTTHYLHEYARFPKGGRGSRLSGKETLSVGQ